MYKPELCARIQVIGTVYHTEPVYVPEWRLPVVPEYVIHKKHGPCRVSRLVIERQEIKAEYLNKHGCVVGRATLPQDRGRYDSYDGLEFDYEGHKTAEILNQA